MAVRALEEPERCALLRRLIVMLWFLLSLFLTAVVIVFVAGATSSLEVEGFGAALIAAFIMIAVGGVAAIPIGMLQTVILGAIFGTTGPPGQVSDPQTHAVYLLAVGVSLAFVINILLFGVVASVTPGITVRGIWGVVLAAAMITVVDVVFPYLLVTTGSPVVPVLWGR